MAWPLNLSCLSLQGMEDDPSWRDISRPCANSMLSGLFLPQTKVWPEGGSHCPVLTCDRSVEARVNGPSHAPVPRRPLELWQGEISRPCRSWVTLTREAPGNCDCQGCIQLPPSTPPTLLLGKGAACSAAARMLPNSTCCLPGCAGHRCPYGWDP